MECVVPSFFMRPSRDSLATIVRDVSSIQQEVLGINNSASPQSSDQGEGYGGDTAVSRQGWFRGMALNYWDGWGEMEDDTQSSKPYLMTTVTTSSMRRLDGKDLILVQPTSPTSPQPPQGSHDEGSGNRMAAVDAVVTSPTRALPPMIAVVSIQSVMRHHSSHKRLSHQLSVFRIKRYLQWFAKYSSRLESSAVLADDNLTGVLSSFHTAPATTTKHHSCTSPHRHGEGSGEESTRILRSVFQALIPEGNKNSNIGTPATPPAVTTASMPLPKLFCIDVEERKKESVIASGRYRVFGEDGLSKLLAGFEIISDSQLPSAPKGSSFPANTIEQLPNVRMLSKLTRNISGRWMDDVVNRFLPEVYKAHPNIISVVRGGHGDNMGQVHVQFMCLVHDPCLLHLLNEHLRVESKQHQLSSPPPRPQQLPFELSEVSLLRHRGSGRFYSLLTLSQMHLLYALYLHRRWALEERCRRYSTGSSLVDEDAKEAGSFVGKGVMTQWNPQQPAKYVPQAFDSKGGRLDMLSPHQIQFGAVESGSEIVIGVTGRVLAHTGVSMWKGLGRRGLADGTPDVSPANPPPHHPPPPTLGGTVVDAPVSLLPQPTGIISSSGSIQVGGMDASPTELISALLTRSSSSSSESTGVTSRQVSHSGFRGGGSSPHHVSKGSSIADNKQLQVRHRLEGSQYTLAAPSIAGSCCHTSSSSHLAISPLAQIQHSTSPFTTIDATEVLVFFDGPQFTKGDLQGMFTTANGCLPGSDVVEGMPAASNPFPIRYLYLDPLQTDVRGVNYVNLSTPIPSASPSTSPSHSPTLPHQQPPTMSDLFSMDSREFTAPHIPYGLLYNPLHQITSIARYAIEGIEASRIRRRVLGCVGNIAIKLVEATTAGERLSATQRRAVSVDATLLFLSCHSATKGELATYTTMLAADFARVAGASGITSISSQERIVRYLHAVPGTRQTGEVHAGSMVYTPDSLRSLAISALRGSDLPSSFYIASAFAFHFCGNQGWWVCSGGKAVEGEDCTKFVWPMLQDLITILGELLRWFEGRHDCHFELIGAQDNERVSKLMCDVSRGDREEAIAISLHPADYGVLQRGPQRGRGPGNPFCELPDALTLVSDCRLFEATKRMRTVTRGDPSNTSSELYQGLLEDLSGGIPYHQLGAMMYSPEEEGSGVVSPSTPSPPSLVPKSITGSAPVATPMEVAPSLYAGYDRYEGTGGTSQRSTYPPRPPLPLNDVSLPPPTSAPLRSMDGMDDGPSGDWTSF